MDVYRSKAVYLAVQLSEDQTIVTVSGPIRANSGDFLVSSLGGIHIVDEATFTEGYELVPDNVPSPGTNTQSGSNTTSSGSETTTVNDQSNGDALFHPGGNTVDVVTQFMKDNPGEVDRIKEEEKKGASRTGILSWTA